MELESNIMQEVKISGMHYFEELSFVFNGRFDVRHFREEPKKLYNASQYLLTLKGKRIRPVLCLMGNELFDYIIEDAYHVATAIELFHNFSLVHDDIMDRAPLRRGMPTTHIKFGESTALLAGDIMLVAAYENLNKIDSRFMHPILSLFNDTAAHVCEGQQMDMDFENNNEVNFEDYVEMISLKTSVLLAASLQLGAILGGAGLGNQQHIYQFGKNLGIAFQVQDDYLDAFGNPEKFGKQQGGDIMTNKKTFLLLETLKVATAAQREELNYWMSLEDESKIAPILEIYKSCKVDAWAKELKQKYFDLAMFHLEEIAVLSSRKKPLMELANYLMDREV